MARLCKAFAALAFAACTLGGLRAEDGLVLSPLQIAPDVYAFIGVQEEISPANRGNVINSGFIVGPDGVIVIDTGVNVTHGRAILAAIREVTDRPVVLIINTHPHPENVLGNNAFLATGAPILARQETIGAMNARCKSCYVNVEQILGKPAMAGTDIVIPNLSVSGNGSYLAGGRRIELYHFGWGHTEGDLSVFDPVSGVLFASDLVHLDRIPHTHEAQVKGWIHALDELRKIPAKRIVPGRGPVADPRRIGETQDYLNRLANLIGKHYDKGVSVIDLLKDPSADLPRYQGWALYPETHPLNIQHVYTELEREEFSK
jgi:glyoxylase-like metal-dependent hydrolase (beta-lactamase superfamily II)